MAVTSSGRVRTSGPVDRRARLVLLMLGLFSILNFGDKAVLGLAGPSLRADLGLSHTDLGTIGSAFYLLFSISCLAVGLIGHRWPSTWLLAGLAVVWAVAQLPILIPAAGFGALIVTRVILGAGEGPALPTATHVAFTWYPPAQRTMVSGVLAMSGALGVIIGGPILAATIAFFGWRAAFGLLGVTGLVWAAFWVAIGGFGPFTHTSGTDPVDGDELRPSEHAESPLPLARIARTPTWLAVVVSGFTAQYVLGLAMSWLPTYLQDEAGFSETRAGFLVALPSLIALVAVPIAITGSRRMLTGPDGERAGSPVRGYAVLALALAGVPALAFFLLTTSPSGPVLLLCIALAFGASVGLVPIGAAAIADLVPVRSRGPALALATAVSSLGAVASPWITGRLLDVLSTPAAGFSAAFIVAAALLVAGGFALLLVHPSRDSAGLGGPRPALTGG